MFFLSAMFLYVSLWLFKWLTLLNQVVECVNADALVVRMPDGVQKKIHFSSLRPPR